MNVLHYFLQHRSIYIHFLFLILYRPFKIYWMYECVIFIIYEVRRDELFSCGLWNIKSRQKSRLYVDILMFLAMGVIRIKATPLRHFCNISDFSGFGFVFCFFVLLSVRICFVLMCWCLKRRGGGGEISPLYFLYTVVRFRQRKRKLISFILHMRTDRNWYLIYAHSRVFRMRYDDLVSIFSSAD